MIVASRPKGGRATMQADVQSMEPMPQHHTLLFVPFFILINLLFFIATRSTASGKPKARMLSLDALVAERYDAMLAPFYWVVELFLPIMCISTISASQQANMAAFNVTSFDFMGLSAAKGSVLEVLIVMLFSLFVRGTSAWLQLVIPQRNAAYRWLCVSCMLSFRLLRINDLLSANDRLRFVRTTGKVLSQHDLTSTWCSFLLGWLLGMWQPTPKVRISDRLMIFTAIANPAISPMFGWCLTGDGTWLAVSSRLLILPSLLGFVTERLQRRVVKHVLASYIAKELALALPGAGDFARQPGAAGASAPGKGIGAWEAEPALPSRFQLCDFEPVCVLGFGGSAQVRLMRNQKLDNELQAVKSIFKSRAGR